MEENELLAQRKFLSDLGAWPPPSRLHLEAWLSNFESGTDRQIALELLDSLVHLNESQLQHATRSAFGRISTDPALGIGVDLSRNWRNLMDTAIVTFPAGSDGDITTSGSWFAREIRDAGFDERRIKNPTKAVEYLRRSSSPVPVIWLDDLTATGTQFCRTWQRNTVVNGDRVSFSSVELSGKMSHAYFCPIIATTAALEKIETVAPNVRLLPAYLLSETESARHENTEAVTPELAGELPSFLEKYGLQSGNSRQGHYGYGDSGLVLTFHHGVPNNSLPILAKRAGHTAPSWKTLIQ